MPLRIAVWLAAICWIGWLSCRKVKRLKNTSRGMLLCGCLLTAYCILTLAMVNGGA